MITRSIGVGIRPVPRRHSSVGNREGNVEKNTEIPAIGQLVAMQENPVDQQYRTGVGRRKGRRNLAIVPMIEPGRLDSTGAEPERQQQIPLEGIVIIGIKEIALGAVFTTKITNLSRMVKTIHACANDRVPRRLHNSGKLIGESRLPRTVNAIDGNDHTILREAETSARHMFQKLTSDRILFHAGKLEQGTHAANILLDFHEACEALRR